MTLTEVSQDQYDEDIDNSASAQKGSANYEVVTRSSSLMNLVDNDDETFKRAIARRKVFPHTESDEGEESET